MGGSLSWEQMTAGHNVSKVYNGAVVRGVGVPAGTDLAGVKEGCVVSCRRYCTTEIAAVSVHGQLKARTVQRHGCCSLKKKHFFFFLLNPAGCACPAFARSIRLSPLVFCTPCTLNWGPSDERVRIRFGAHNLLTFPMILREKNATFREEYMGR